MTAAADSTATEHRRATVRPDKAEAVAEITEAFRAASAAVLTEYRGLSVKQITALRVALGPTTSYSVVKNTLTTIAAGEAGLDGLGLVGPDGGPPVLGRRAVGCGCHGPPLGSVRVRAWGRHEPWNARTPRRGRARGVQEPAGTGSGRVACAGRPHEAGLSAAAPGSDGDRRSWAGSG